MAEGILANQSLDLQRYIPADPARRAALPGYRPGHDLPYHLVRRGDAVYYGYPLGSTLLSLPFVHHYVSQRGLSSLDAGGVPQYLAEAELQVRIAARVGALTVLLLYALTRCYCSVPISVFIALGFAFGSPVWSTLSRALWSHTWMVFWVSAALLTLVASRRLSQPARLTDLAFGLGLGTTLFWAVFCRQHAILSLLAIGVYLLLHNRRLLLFTILAGALWSILLIAFSLAYFGTPIPPSVYTAGMIDGRDVLSRFTWLMVSPTRGLLVYCPYLVVVGGLLVCYRRYLTDAPLLLPAVIVLSAHTALFSCYNGWHANWAYGPRYFCDVLPWFVLLTAQAVNALGAMPAPHLSWRRVTAMSALAVCFGWGVFVHARGANSKEAWHWNDLARAVGDEAAVKDWRHPQFLAGLTFAVNPDGSIRQLP